jgi:carboxypeptidase family protein
LLVRRWVAGCLITLTATSSLPGAIPLSLLRGSLRLEATGAPAGGAEVRLIQLDTGRVVVARASAAGDFEARLEPGLYALDVGRDGYEIASGPRIVAATEGRAVTAALGLIALQGEPARSVGPRIVHEALGCMAADQNPEIEAIIEPAASVTRPRVYFHSAREQRFHYVEMLPEVGRFVACLPQPRADSGPVTYYVSAAAREVESRTADITAEVVGDGKGCPSGRRMAVMCPCSTPVAAFLPGGAASVPAGFSGVAGALAGASAANAAAAVAIAISAVGIGLMMSDTSPASPSR